MYSVRISFTDGTGCAINHVEKAMYTKSDTKTITGDDLLTEKIPFGVELRLFSPKETNTVSLHGVRMLAIEKEE